MTKNDYKKLSSRQFIRLSQEDQKLISLASSKIGTSVSEYVRSRTVGAAIDELKKSK